MQPPDICEKTDFENALQAFIFKVNGRRIGTVNTRGFKLLRAEDIKDRSNEIRRRIAELTDLVWDPRRLR